MVFSVHRFWKGSLTLLLLVVVYSFLCQRTSIRRSVRPSVGPWCSFLLDSAKLRKNGQKQLGISKKYVVPGGGWKGGGAHSKRTQGSVPCKTDPEVGQPFFCIELEKVTFSQQHSNNEFFLLIVSFLRFNLVIGIFLVWRKYSLSGASKLLLWLIEFVMEFFKYDYLMNEPKTTKIEVTCRCMIAAY